MVHWVYILECEDDYIYVGETKRLFRRFDEHTNHHGAVNTSNHRPLHQVALYKVADNISFLHYKNCIKNGEYNPFVIEDWGKDEDDYLNIENHFTEMLLYLRSSVKGEHEPHLEANDGEWKKVRGGKYTKELAVNPTSKMDPADIMDRPLCDCHYPCEVKLSKDKKCIYFVCAASNQWEDRMGCLRTGSNCNFYKVYTDDAYVKKQYEICQRRLKEQWAQNLPKSRYKIHPEPCIKCNNTDYFPVYAYGSVRLLCQECLISKYNELKTEFLEPPCLITDD